MIAFHAVAERLENDQTTWKSDMEGMRKSDCVACYSLNFGGWLEDVEKRLYD